MIKINQAVIVEGKYDKITLENMIDALILPTNGFAIFKDKEKRELIRTLALRDGIIVMTDSDRAGMMIRAHLKQICPTGSIINVYIPQLSGKERRKDKLSKEGLLGVEGMSADVIRTALERSGITGETAVTPTTKITKTDLFLFGLSGGTNSAALRQELCKHLGLPVGFSANAFLDIVNVIYGYDEFVKAVKSWQEETDKK